MNFNRYKLNKYFIILSNGCIILNNHYLNKKIKKNHTFNMINLKHNKYSDQKKFFLGGFHKKSNNFVGFFNLNKT